MAIQKGQKIPSKNTPKRKVDFLERVLGGTRDSIIKRIKNAEIDVEDPNAVGIFLLKELTKML